MMITFSRIPKTLIAYSATITSLVFAAGCSTETETDDTTTSEQALTGGCLPGVNTCLRNGGGGKCIAKH